MQQDQPPYDIEELAIEHHQSGNWDEAKKLFSLLVRLFPSYAGGYNYLGLLALNEDQPKEAAEFLRQAIKEGRKLFPRRTSKKDYWMELDTRPFMRGYMNLPIALNRAGKWKEALEVCDQMAKECGERAEGEAIAHRAAAQLNLHHWEECVAESLKLSKDKISKICLRQIS